MISVNLWWNHWNACKCQNIHALIICVNIIYKIPKPSGRDWVEVRKNLWKEVISSFHVKLVSRAWYLQQDEKCLRFTRISRCLQQNHKQDWMPFYVRVWNLIRGCIVFRLWAQWKFKCMRKSIKYCYASHARESQLKYEKGRNQK